MADSMQELKKILAHLLSFVLVLATVSEAGVVMQAQEPQAAPATSASSYTGRAPPDRARAAAAGGADRSVPGRSGRTNS